MDIVIEEPKADYRIGIGTDIHGLIEGRELMLCGIYVPHPVGLAGHSDGDVGLHAVIDALLGASGMGDIGTLFIVKEQLEEKRWEVVNVDLTIHAEAPKLEPLKGQMKRCIAGLLGIDFTSVNVKAKTNEGFGDIGAGQAMAATAAVLLKKKRKRTL